MAQRHLAADGSPDLGRIARELCERVEGLSSPPLSVARIALVEDGDARRGRNGGRLGLYVQTSRPLGMDRATWLQTLDGLNTEMNDGVQYGRKTRGPYLDVELSTFWHPGAPAGAVTIYEGPRPYS